MLASFITYIATEINSSQCLNGKGFRLYTSSVVTSLGVQIIVTYECPVTSLCLFNSTSHDYLYSLNLSFQFLSTNKHIAIVVEQSLETLLQCFHIFICWHREQLEDNVVPHST